MKTTKSDLIYLVGVISEITGISTEKKDGEESHMILECNSNYGGYRLVKVKNDNGGHFGIFGGNGSENRLTVKEMKAKLEGIISGLKFNK